MPSRCWSRMVDDTGPEFSSPVVAGGSRHRPGGRAPSTEFRSAPGRWRSRQGPSGSARSETGGAATFTVMAARRGHLRSRAWLGTGVLLMVATACGGATSATPPAAPAAPTTTKAVPTTTQAAPPTTVPATDTIVWSSCPAGSTLQCGSVSVPLDYQHPLGASITLAVTRAPALDASHPAGSLVFNPGGPGESGNQILPVVLGLLPAAVRQHFDIVSFDPRGTGASDPLQCGTAPSALTSVEPVPSASGRPLPGAPAFTAMANACRQQPAVALIDTFNTARDMDKIRAAMGLATISFYGMSYGTVLGSVYADLFPSRVGTMVLDGAVDVNASLTRQAVQEAPAAERSLGHLLTACSPQPACPLGARPRWFFRSLASALSRHPLPAPGGGDSYPVTVGDLDTATLLVLSVPQFSPSFYAALVAADKGNGAPLRALALQLATDINGAPLVDPLWAITCNDAAGHPGPIAAGTLARSLHSRFPLIGAYSVTYTMGGCVSWPEPRQPVADLHPKGTPPILVIGNTGDPNTPLVNAAHLATIFPTAALLTWKGWGHTWLLSGSGDHCMQHSVSTYLSGGGLPRHGTVCS
jgi:pimeloyl-ACP methyl ester carboxylesterase